MNSSAEKTSKTASASTPEVASQPFVGKAGGGDFFAPTQQQGRFSDGPSKSATGAGRQKSDGAGTVRGIDLDEVLSSEIVDLSSNVFSPSDALKAEIAALGNKGLTVRVMVKGLTGEGLIKIRSDKNNNYNSIGRGAMPLLNPWSRQLGGMFLNFTISNSEIKGGYASLKERGGDRNDWLQSVKKGPDILGAAGLKVGNLPTPVNKFDNGKLTLGVSNLKIEVGGFVDALLNFTLENDGKPQIDVVANIDVKGMAQGQLKLDNSQGRLAGEVQLAIGFKSFTGMGKVKLNPDGTVDAAGSGAYNANKLSGEIQFVSTDQETANNFARNAITAAGGKENIQNAPPPQPVPAPKPGKKQRSLAATGQLAFNMTTWFAGSVFVVVDGKGNVTVIGKIAPPGEKEIFKQKDTDKELVKFEAKAYYGLPVVGNLNLFANISLHALASLGPAKIYNIEILGTYSTDPEIQKSIQIAASINISAYAGLRLRAEGGAAVEIVSHDLKFGIGLNADVGVKAYADARPTIGFREPGEFYISGTLEMVAQPMLGLGGDFFIKLETPWWSPLSDDKWTWPLFKSEWPMSDPIGINASVKEYVFGSGKVPEVELKKPEFDPSKFMTNMVDRTLPDKSGSQGAGQGTFKEDGTVQKPVVPPKKEPPKKSAEAPVKKKATPKAGKSGVLDPNAAKEQANTKVFERAAKPLASLKGKGPLAQAELSRELVKIKTQVNGIDFGFERKAAKWVVMPRAGGKTGKALMLDAKPSGINEEDAKPIENVTEELRDASFRESFDMGAVSHSITVGLHERKIRIVVASAEEDLIYALRNAIATEEKNTIREKSQRERILQELHPALARAQSIEHDWIATEAQHPRGGKGTVSYERFMHIRISGITANLRSLAKYNITDLHDLLKKPAKRYIPRSIDIRPALYDKPTEGKWRINSKLYRDREKSKLSAICYAIWKLSATDFNTAESQWNQLIAERKLDPQSIPTFRTFNHPIHFPAFKYETDHIKPLGSYWNDAGQNNMADEDRKTTALDESNWQLLPERENAEKSGPKFRRDVGEKFSSKANDSNKGDSTIGGLPFEDHE